MHRQGVLVLGMHRSGTSLAAGLLVHLGLEGPRTLMPPGEGNPTGYWESVRFFAFHDRLLGLAGTSWDAWTKVENGVSPALGDEFQAILAQEFGTAPRFVVKDPRICRLVPFWTRGLREAGVEPLALLTVRSPSEVALSLAVRDGLPREHSLLMWLRHMLDAERDTRTLRRAAVRYADLLDDWRGEIERIGADLGLEWPVRLADAQAAIDDFVRPDLRHHAAGVDALAGVEPPLSDWIFGATEALNALVRSGPTGAVFERLDEIHGQLDRAAMQFVAWQESVSQAHLKRAAGLEAELEAWYRRAATELESRQQRAAETDAHARHLTKERDLARRQLHAVLDSLSWRATAPLRAMARPFVRTRRDRPESTKD